MAKKEFNKKQSTLLLIAVLLIIVGSCVYFILDASPRKGSKTTPEYLPLQIQGWETQVIKKVCLDINQTYPEEWFGFFKETLGKFGIHLTPHQYEFPYEDLLTEILEEIDVSVASPGEQCDTTLTMNISGTAKSSRYGNIVTKWGNSICYAGSSVSGSLTLSAEGLEPFSTNMKGSVSTPETIFSSNCPDQPYDAPFDESSAEALTGGLVQLWGLDIAKKIRSLYSTGSSSEEAMYDAAIQILKGESVDEGSNFPTVPPAEPATIETTEPRP